MTRRDPPSLSLLILLLLAARPAFAGEPAEAAPAEAVPEDAAPDAAAAQEPAAADAREAEPEPSYSTTVTAERPEVAAPSVGASSEVFRSDLERRLPRSAPDALRYEPGVFVQQTGHGQGSAFIRGLTGQQTLLLFDGIRLNNSTYRQGPNQYFFTLDSRSLDSIEVMRGGGSLRWGSDALGGVLLAHPIEPTFSEDGSSLRPKLLLRGGTADEERGGRLQLDFSTGEKLAMVAGVGGRRVGQLESGGALLNPADGQATEVPRFEDDGRTQRGTGFDELTGDARLVYRPSASESLTLAANAYRQYDAPRTDQCPPPGARWDECLVYEEQFRSLVYGAWEHRGQALPWARATVSWQRQHERRNGSRPASYVVNLGEDDVDTLGLTAQARLPEAELAGKPLRLLTGVDSWFDTLRSRASVGFTDIDVTVERSRGQYLEGSTYLYGGAFADAELRLTPLLRLEGGARLSWIRAQAPGDEASGTRAIDAAWFPLVGRLGARWRIAPPLSLLINLDRSFRAPNLDDLTSRQQTGPGFQFENPDLGPERATTLEAGAQVRHARLIADAWAFATVLDGAVGKLPMEASACPANTPQCQSSWTRFMLVNARSASLLWGVEGSARVQLPWQLQARFSASYAWGEGPNLAEPPTDPSLPYEERVPLTRVPPLNGTAELYRAPASGFGGGAALRWATTQDRLAVADRSDARIPLGGTPGFAVLDLRASWRLDKTLAAVAVLENLFDTPYRYHGSSVNGPGRGLTLSLEWTPL